MKIALVKLLKTGTVVTGSVNLPKTLEQSVTYRPQRNTAQRRRFLC
jgi:hypothetical protein